MMTNDELLDKFKIRFSDMDSEKQKRAQEREYCDKQQAALIQEDAYGRVNSNSPLEASLLDMEIGRTSGRPVFDITPDPYDYNPQEVEISKYILDSFLDREEFATEYRAWRIDRAIYGTGILFCGLRYDITTSYTATKSETSDQIGNGFFSKSKKISKEKEKWYMTPVNIPIRNFRIDDSAMNQWDFRKARDCILVEYMDIDSFQKKFSDEKIFNQEEVKSVTETAQVDPQYGIPTTKGMVAVYQYYNKVDGVFGIIANNTTVLVNIEFPYQHGELPFAVGQFYINNSCIYSYGIHKRTRLSKAYLNNITDNILSGSRLSSSKILGLGSGGEPVDGDIYAIPGEISMARFTQGVEQLKTIDTQVNISGLVQARQIVNEMVRNDTGYDMNSPFEAPASTLGQTEIIEENKQIRYKTIDESRDQTLDRALTFTLKNIVQYVPTLLRRTKQVKNDKGEVIEEFEKRPNIQIKNVKIMKKGNEQIIEEDFGNYGYLEFTDETIKGDLKVRVITPNTHNPTLVTIEKNKAKEMVENYISLMQISPEQVQEQLPVSEVIEKFKKAYGYSKNMIPMTKKRAIEKENEQKLANLKELLSSEPIIPNDPTMQEPIQQGEQTEGTPTTDLSAISGEQTTQRGAG